MRHLKIVLCTLVAIACVAFLWPATALAISASTIIGLTNQQRLENGLQPLNVNTDLMTSASAKASDMITRDYWAHYAPDGTSPWYFISQSGYKYKGAGENLAMDFTDDQSVMSAWMASPEHRANILNPAYQDIGVAVVEGSLLGHETTLVVVHFGIPAQIETAVAVATPPPAPTPVTAVSAVPTASPPSVMAAQPLSRPLPSKPTNNSALTMFKLTMAQMWLVPFIRMRWPV